MGIYWGVWCAICLVTTDISKDFDQYSPEIRKKWGIFAGNMIVHVSWRPKALVHVGANVGSFSCSIACCVWPLICVCDIYLNALEFLLIFFFIAQFKITQHGRDRREKRYLIAIYIIFVTFYIFCNKIRLEMLVFKYLNIHVFKFIGSVNFLVFII